MTWSMAEDILPMAVSEPQHDTQVLVSWPNGWHRHLSVNTAPFENDAGGVDGAVAAFVEREPASPTHAR